MSSVSSGDASSSLILCRFPLDVPLALNRGANAPFSSLPAFERWLEDCLTDTVLYKARSELCWLGCQRLKQPLQSILGMQEEFDDTLPLIVQCYRASATISSTALPQCSCPTIAHTWSRQRAARGATQALTEVLSISNCHIVQWIDLRDVPVDTTSSQASTLHLLRTVLPQLPSASPWIVDPTNDTVVDCVCLILDSNLATSIMDFRVADANPSYYLLSIASVELSDVNNWTEAANSTAAPATLLVYRRLPPRQGLSQRHPATNQLVPSPSALWYTTIPSRQDDDEGDSEDAPPQTTILVAPPYLDALEEYPMLASLLTPDHLQTLTDEARAIAHWTAWPEEQHYTSRNGSDDAGATATWSVFPLCHCFPASEIANRVWIAPTCAVVPQTVALLQSLLGDTLRTALFSRLEANSVLEAHTGWDDLANHVIRVHLPLLVPSSFHRCCGTWVDGVVEHHRTGQFLAFDDSKTHWAFNYGASERIVLILDLARPGNLPMGTARGGHSDELDKFIEKMGMNVTR